MCTSRSIHATLPQSNNWMRAQGVGSSGVCGVARAVKASSVDELLITSAEVREEECQKILDGAA